MSDDDFCCGCCLGLIVGATVFGNQAHGSTVELKPTHPAAPSSIESVVKENHSIAQKMMLKGIYRYQTEISPSLHDKGNGEQRTICKYEPSCSEYAKIAIDKYGATKGTAIAATRLLKCNPLSKGGYDPLR